MNILFVVNSLSDTAGANVNIVRTLTKLLSKKGCKIYVLGKSDCRRPSSETVKKEFECAYLLPSDRFEIIPNLYDTLKIKNKKIQEFAWLFNHPGILCKGLDIKIGNSFWTIKEYSKCIEKICREKQICAVIGVAAPYEMAQAVSNANIKAIKAIYQLDPYTNNYTLKGTKKEKRKKVEIKTINNVNLLFVPDFIKNDLLKNKICTESNKMIDANLPGIIIDNIKQTEMKQKANIADNTINLVFAGTLYEDIRNPGPLLDLMTFLPENYRLHIFGVGCEKQIEASKNRLKDKLVYHGLVSKQEADDYVTKADALINIDNTIKNQMPSKVVDYICQQKKIINICMDLECLAAKLLVKYPNSINICYNEKNIHENAELIVNFMKSNINIPTVSKILEDYKEYTDNHIAEIIYNTLSKFC